MVPIYGYSFALIEFNNGVSKGSFLVRERNIVLTEFDARERPPIEAALPAFQVFDRQSRNLRRVSDAGLCDLDYLLRDHFR
jgi:hypothetical protein